MHSIDEVYVYCDRYVTRSVVCVSVCVLVTLMYCVKTAKRSRCRLGDWLTWVQGTMYSMGVKIGQICSQPQG